MRPFKEIMTGRPWLAWVLFLSIALIVFLLGLFAASIIERRSESVLTFQIVKPIKDWEPRNEVWGQNFPREYESYKRTAETRFSSKYAGNGMIDYLQNDPKLVILWAGYAFSKDYKQARGHFYAIADIQNTLRTVQPQPATCWTCKSTDVPRLMNQMGFVQFYQTKWSDLGSQVTHSIGCQDCHDPKTMNLRLTRSALIEALERQGKKIDSLTHQQMRTLVCAQCHVEYYFKGEGKYLTFPWDNGLTADDMEAYYDSKGFSDWTHGLSRAPMLKAQHPDYELYQRGIHADRAIACADCHMPYRSEGGIKFSDHQVQSPLNSLALSCQVCHREDEAKLKQNIYERQDRVAELKDLAETTLVQAHFEAKAAWEQKATQEEMNPALQLIRQAQWRWDWVTSSNSMGFHAPIEALRVLAAAIQKAGQARLLLAAVLYRHGAPAAVSIPDISTCDKAQKVIGLDMTKIRAEKDLMLKNLIAQWQKDSLSPPAEK